MIDPETRLERLRQLRRVVAETPAERFCMRTELTSQAESLKACPRCVYGLARLDPWFRTNTPIDDELRIFAGGRAIFGLSFDDAENLFGAGLTSEDPRQPAQAEVLWNIDRLLAGAPALPYDRGYGGEGAFVPYAPDPELAAQ